MPVAVPSRPRTPKPAHHISPDIRRRIAETTHPVECPGGSYIYTPGQRDTNLYVVEDGLVKIQTVSESGKSCILGIRTVGDVFGESGILQDERREAAIALTRVRLRAVPGRRFLQVLTADGLVAEWARYTAARLQEQQETITLLVTVDSRQRLAAVLLMLAAKVGIEQGGRTVIAGRFTHEDLSQMVGTTRSRIGLFLKHFQHDGLVRLSRDSHLVVDEPRLRAYLSHPA
jgi:CRP/FNR family cyclic AMP-dependent transcriptional regulator